MSFTYFSNIDTCYGCFSYSYLVTVIPVWLREISLV